VTEAPATLTPASFREALTPAELAFEQRRRRAGLLIAPFLFLVVLLLPLGLEPRAHRLAAILAGSIVLWITEAVPLPVTGLLGVALAVLFGVDTVREVLVPFSDHLVFLMIGGFMLGEAIFAHGLTGASRSPCCRSPGSARDRRGCWWPTRASRRCCRRGCRTRPRRR
jgi:hypothetical protein